MNFRSLPRRKEVQTADDAADRNEPGEWRSIGGCHDGRLRRNQFRPAMATEFSAQNPLNTTLIRKEMLSTFHSKI